MELTDRPSFERLTGNAWFTPAGDSGAIPWGNIELVKLDAGLTTRDFLASVRGQVFVRKRRALSSALVYQIDGSQFSTAIMPDLLLGVQNADYTQAASGAQTFTFTAAPGRSFRLPVVAPLIASITVGGDEKLLGYDFFVDDPTIEQSLQSHSGWIFLPLASGTIVAGDVVTVNYSVPPLTLEEYSAYSNLSRDGVLVVELEDENGPPVLWQWTASVTVYCKAQPDTQVEQFRTFTFEAAVYGNPVVRRRSQAYGFTEITTDDSGTVLDLS